MENNYPCLMRMFHFKRGHASGQVVLTEGSLGLNTWYETFEYPDTAACTQLKMIDPRTWTVSPFIRSMDL